MFSNIEMDKKVEFLERFSLHSELSKDLTIIHHFMLWVEQTRIEHLARMAEIETLRILLKENGVDATMVESWLDRSDRILDKLLRYKQGKCGKMVDKNLLIMPYRWRRKYRAILNEL
ncbi:hypothetical protein TB147_17445 [Klebsiella aerogenes]|uniref:hypothetical protein n=1 Tax=Klebsiella aerogenes TaxID=548 RepID=UPI002E321CB9|nr:hypothetical protein [Klebsiella aerogenes]MED7793096.1 hypothetical protein [Klebsiella aerogenes]